MTAYRPGLSVLLTGAAIVLLGVGPEIVEGQTRGTATVVPSAEYRPSNALHPLLLGSRYRELWTTPIEVPVLDLAGFAGGLTPVRTGGFQQTRSLRFEGADGREYNFRSVDKELTPAMPPFTRETFVDWIRQDQTSAQMPAAPVVAARLLDAVGILHPGPRLMVMPDDPRLGEFREEFAGMLGTLEVHPNEGEDGERLFADAEVVAGTDRVLEHLEEDLDHRVDERAFLKARLMDVYLGDYDRHEGQWRWARYDRDGLRYWVPIPEDRDYAFVYYDGALLGLARYFGLARLVEMKPEYPDLLAMVDNSLGFTRRLTGGLDWEVWRAVTEELQTQLTDAVIREAVAELPTSHHAIVGSDLESTLRARRDRLPAMARDFYALLSHTVEVHGTEEDDRVEITRLEDGGALVRLWADDDPEPRFDRRLEGDVVEEVRVFLDDGDDEAVVTGPGGGLVVRLIGGEDDDHLVDESDGPTSFHDHEGDNRLEGGPGTWVDRDAPREQPEPADEEDGDAEEDEQDDADPEDLIPGLARDWGEMGSWFAPFVGWEAHAELLIGGGPRFTRYAYRYEPHRSRYWVRGLYAPLASRAGVEGAIDLRRGGSTARAEVTGRIDNLGATVFHGFGNETAGGEPRDFRVWEEAARIAARIFVVDRPEVAVGVGARLERIDPTEPAVGVAALIDASELAGVTRAGAEVLGRMDLTDSPIFPTRGVRIEAEGLAVPSALRAEAGRFGRAEALTSAYVPLGAGVFAMRGGARGAFGDFPFYEAAFLGGSETLRGHHFQRFAGDRAAFGGAELRVPLTPAKILVHGTLGASLFADAGRVWFDGESPGGWHTALGGGLWFRVPIGVATLSYARGEKDRLYFGLGLPF